MPFESFGTSTNRSQKPILGGVVQAPGKPPPTPWGRHRAVSPLTLLPGRGGVLGAIASGGILGGWGFGDVGWKYLRLCSCDFYNRPQLNRDGNERLEETNTTVPKVSSTLLARWFSLPREGVKTDPDEKALTRFWRLGNEMNENRPLP